MGGSLSVAGLTATPVYNGPSYLGIPEDVLNIVVGFLKKPLDVIRFLSCCGTLWRKEIIWKKLCSNGQKPESSLWRLHYVASIKFLILSSKAKPTPVILNSFHCKNFYHMIQDEGYACIVYNIKDNPSLFYNFINPYPIKFEVWNLKTVQKIHQHDNSVVYSVRFSYPYIATVEHTSIVLRNLNSPNSHARSIDLGVMEPRPLNASYFFKLFIRGGATPAVQGTKILYGFTKVEQPVGTHKESLTKEECDQLTDHEIFEEVNARKARVQVNSDEKTVNAIEDFASTCNKIDAILRDGNLLAIQCGSKVRIFDQSITAEIQELDLGEGEDIKLFKNNALVTSCCKLSEIYFKIWNTLTKTSVLENKLLCHEISKFALYENKLFSLEATYPNWGNEILFQERNYNPIPVAKNSDRQKGRT